jgi:NAD(P)-dependent dehydrogenase (short-subunit alcohol dehydrogenase family)
LGLESCRQLREEGFRVILTSREEKEGIVATGRLDPEAHDVIYHPLDVTDPASISTLVGDLSTLAPRLDVLVNNAGIATRGGNVDAARRTLAVNYSGARDVTDALVPFMPRGGRVVMVSSGLGELSYLGRNLRPRFADETLTRSTLDTLVSSFLQAAERGTQRKGGWPSAYSVSKVALNALTRILARELSPRGIAVNSVCPGWVRTDMGGPGAPRSVSVGALSILLGVKLPGDATGGFYRDGKRIPW